MSGSHVLVVDDEAIVRDVLTRYLEREGFRVDVAADGEAALDLAARSRPDIVVLDLMLPKIDGLEVFRRLRDGGDLPVVMLTAKGEEVDRLVGLELGADDYISQAVLPTGGRRARPGGARVATDALRSTGTVPIVAGPSRDRPRSSGGAA